MRSEESEARGMNAHLLGRPVTRETFGHQKHGRICSVSALGPEIQHLEVEWRDGSMTRVTPGQVRIGVVAELPESVAPEAVPE